MMWRKVLGIVFLVAVVIIATTTSAEVPAQGTHATLQLADVQQEKTQPHGNVASIKSIVKEGSVVKINAEWRYKVYVNGKQVIDPFLTANYWSLSSFTIAPKRRAYYGFSLVTLSGESVGSYLTFTSSNILLKKITTNYNYAGTALANVTTTLIFTLSSSVTTTYTGIVPVDAGSYWNFLPSSSHYYYSLMIPGTFTGGNSYAVMLVDTGIQFNDPNIADGSYLFLLRGFGKTGSASYSFVLSDGTTVTPTLVVEQSKIDFYTAKLDLKLINADTTQISVSEVKVTFDGMTYGRIIFNNPVTLGPADAIVLSITINA